MNTFNFFDFQHLYNACIYSSIANAVSNLKQPFFSYAQSWDDNNYSFIEGMTRGTISFDFSKKNAVCAIRDDTSKRRNMYPSAKAINLFLGAGEDIVMLAEKEALEYLYDEKDCITQPMATTAFWITNDVMMSNDTESEIASNGGSFVLAFSQSIEGLCKYWQEKLDFENNEISAVNYIYQNFSKKYIKASELPIDINNCDGHDEFIDALIAIGITVI